ncbi:hypothetical protein [Leucobacter chromiireducens]|uniref:sunset domain-containing protein n=1 Tax=Leucobacter chromiireducens TaxID=283877 RepID=UPI000F63FB99|nr:hypothetical protein [Leucobacter chromiireducens]
MRKLLGVLLTAGLVLGLPAGPALAVGEDGSGVGAEQAPVAAVADAPVGAPLTAPSDPAEPGAGGEFTDPNPEAGEGEPGAAEPIAAPTQLPAIAGTARVGQTILGTRGEWNAEDLEFALQWQIDGVDAAGATGESFSLLPEHAGASVRLAVTASRSGAEPLTAYSEPVLVEPGTLSVGALRVAGATVVGQKLSVTAGESSPSGATLQFQWKRAGVAIAGATGTSYTLTAKDLGTRVTVTATATLAGYTTAAATAGGGTAVTAGALTTATPKISGSAVVGSTLKSSVGSWKPSGVALKYQWKRNGSVIAKATGASYKLTTADAGKKITLSVTGSLAGYTGRTVTSAATGTVLRTLSATPTPKISGTSKVGSKLTVSAGAWKPAKVSLSYQWLRGGRAISGATKSSYTLTKADGGAKISVRVTGKKSGYVSVSKTSGARSIPKVLRTATPTISGSALVGSTLTVKRGTWTSGTKLSTQWLRNGAVIRGKTGTSYTLGSADRGAKISVRVTGSKSGYSTASKVSRATGAVKTPSRTSPNASWNCPAWAPIKGNQGRGDWIYHVPGSTYFSRTIPEECFSTVAAAQAAGYRAPRR